VGARVEFNKEELDIVGARVMAGGRPPSSNSFTCPNCKALYHIVKVEAGSETVHQEVPCRVCAAPLVGREGNFVLKYFLLREAARVQKWRRRIEKPQPASASGRG
jgi:hypothetical protein